MIFSHDTLGMEIAQHGVKMVRVGGRLRAPKLLAQSCATFPPEVLRVLHREANVLQPASFVNIVKETANKLLSSTGRVSVSLPDAAGRVMILDFETRFKSKDEGRDMIRWKLKKSLPFDVSDVHLDYQPLRQKDNGELSVLVALMAKNVVTQYEDLLLEAGLQPNKIDFSTFNLYRLFSRRLELSESPLYIAFHHGVLSILIFTQGVLDFYRTKEISDVDLDINRIFMEINNSLVFYRDRNPGCEFKEIFCHVSPAREETFATVLREACGIEPVILHPDLVVSSAEPSLGKNDILCDLAAALGAATRNL
ncbi:type IV pilus biogenesis protein PilM [Geotalea uraniireducens]|nr:pilus assembly protein PilM [Geotalea uraniireducens]